MSILGLEPSRTMMLAKKALDYRAIRQDMISSNIANADTPFYKPRDIRFQDALKIEETKLLQESSPKLAMAQTDKAHIALQDDREFSKPTTFFRDGHMARNDGNSVDIDVETTEMSKNSILFNALIRAMKKEGMIYGSVIDASSKIQ